MWICMVLVRIFERMPLGDVVLYTLIAGSFTFYRHRKEEVSGKAACRVSISIACGVILIGYFTINLHASVDYRSLEYALTPFRWMLEDSRYVFFVLIFGLLPWITRVLTAENPGAALAAGLVKVERSVGLLRKPLSFLATMGRNVVAARQAAISVTRPDSSTTGAAAGPVPGGAIVIKQPISLGQRLHTVFMLVKIGAVIWICLLIYSITPAFVAQSSWWAVRHALGAAWPF